MVSKVIRYPNISEIKLPDHLKKVPVKDPAPAIAQEKARIQRTHGTYRPVPQGAPLAETDIVVFDAAITSGELPDKFNRDNITVNLGKNFYDPAVEKALLDAKVGETLDVAVQDGTVRVTVNRAKRLELPELTDELVAAEGMDGIDSIAALEAAIKDETREMALMDFIFDQVMPGVEDYLLDHAEFAIDEKEQEEKITAWAAEAETVAEQEGMDPIEMMTRVVRAEPGISEKDLRARYRESLKKEFRFYLILRDLADKLDVKTERADYEAMIAQAEAEGFSREDIESQMSFAEFQEQMGHQAATEYIIDTLREQLSY